MYHLYNIAAMLTEKTCENCGNAFHAKRKDNIFCSPRCRREAHFKSKTNGSLNGSETVHPVTPEVRPISALPAPLATLPKISNLKPPGNLDIAAQFVIDTLKEQNADLKAQLIKVTDKFETVSKERADLEKQLDKAQDELDKKPTGLGAVFSNPDSLEKMLSEAPNVIASIAGVIKELRSGDQPQLNAPSSGQQEHSLIAWLKQQPAELQDAFIQMVNGLAQNPSRAMEMVSYFNRSMMQAGLKTATS